MVRGAPGQGELMFKPEQYRAKATEYGDLAKSSISPKQSVDFEKLERSFTVLADNEQWLAENYQNTLGGAQRGQFGGVTLADEEEHILRCLGAALIMQWNTLPTTATGALRQCRLHGCAIADFRPERANRPFSAQAQG